MAPGSMVGTRACPTAGTPGARSPAWWSPPEALGCTRGLAGLGTAGTSHRGLPPGVKPRENPTTRWPSRRPAAGAGLGTALQDRGQGAGHRPRALRTPASEIHSEDATELNALRSKPGQSSLPTSAGCSPRGHASEQCRMRAPLACEDKTLPCRSESEN